MLALFKRHVFSKVNVLMKNVVDKNRLDTEMGAWYKLNQLILNKRLSFKWFYFSMFAYILCNTNSVNIWSYVDKITKAHWNNNRLENCKFYKKKCKFYRLKSKFYRKKWKIYRLKCKFYRLKCKFYRLKCKFYRKKCAN